MRVIAGSAKRIPLKTVDGMQTRPTTDRIKETLFNMIQPWLLDAEFLDLFAGSGAIGIEALSRGAKHAYFAEQSRQAVSCIRENLKNTKLDRKGEILSYDVLQALQILQTQGKHMDIIFMDPPYNKELEKKVLTVLSKSLLVHEDTQIIVEASLDTSFSYLDDLGFVCVRQKMYKTNQHIFIQRKE